MEWVLVATGMDPVKVQVLVAGSKTSAVAVDSTPVRPPDTSTRPSASKTVAAKALGECSGGIKVQDPTVECRLEAPTGPLATPDPALATPDPATNAATPNATAAAAFLLLDCALMTGLLLLPLTSNVEPIRHAP